MEQYIKKSILVTEIERLIAELVEEGENTMFEQGRISAFEDVKVFINHTLEVKEVDLEKEISNWWDNHYHKKFYKLEGYTGHYTENSTILDIAKHFFELGLKAQKGE